MDYKRFEQVCHNVEFGGLPEIKNERFTKEQKDKLTKLLEERSRKTLEYIKDIKLERNSDS